MGKGSTVLGVIALILGAGGLGLGGLAWISVSRVETQVTNQNSWFKYNNTAFNSDPVGPYLIFSGLTIEFNLGLGESVYFSFSSWAHIEAVPGGWSRIIVYFRVDGVMELSPNTIVGMYMGDFTNHYSVHLQDVRDDLLPGMHTVTVVISGTYSANYIRESSLFVQKVTT